ncbi:hypothetical protein [Amedibacillus sp. YH-ame10]
MKNIILVRNLKDKESAKKIESALSETRTDFEIDLERQCVVIEGNSDMVSIARKVITDLGFLLL